MTTQEFQFPATIPFLDEENWWGGRTGDGVLMPFTLSTRHQVELHTDLGENQGAPFLLSSKGRFIWSESPFAYQIENGSLLLTGATGSFILSDGHETLAGAFKAASRQHFAPAGKIPPEEFFVMPQYNTWIELKHEQSQHGVLKYAHDLLKHGFPPGILMIDAGWAEYFGSFQFHAGRFPDPKAMMSQLKNLGFKVLLWISPYLSADSIEYRRWRNRTGWLLRNRDGKPAILEWWDGHSAHFDPTHPEAMEWFRGELSRLQNDYGIDGFKFDAGDALHYKNRPASWLNAQPVEICEAWARFGLNYPYNEYRACWKLAGQPLVQRLHDCAPDWSEKGLAGLIPNSISLGLIGHPFVCPDMIGGGDYSYFLNNDYMDEELFVRFAQASALFPMMQFSCAPWRVLSKANCQLCLDAVKLHVSFRDEFMRLAREAAGTGEPMLRSLEYEFPHQGYALVKDQFLMGKQILAAPVLVSGARKRSIIIPPGLWRDDRGIVTQGPEKIEVDAPLDRLPWWRCIG